MDIENNLELQENNLELQKMQISAIIALISDLSIQTNQLVKNISIVTSITLTQSNQLVKIILIVTSITLTLVICILIKMYIE
jgi:hypothetical protein